MPRDANGNYTLPAGNPVVTGTTVETAWANPTMDDIKQALTDSLDRYGRGGMQAPFRFIDGTAGQPGMSWASELSTGFYRAGAADQRATVAGIPMMRWTNVGVDVWDLAGAAWLPLTSAAGGNFALLNAANVFTATPQRIVNPTPALQLFKDVGLPTEEGYRLAYNLAVASAVDISYWNGSAWAAKFIASPTASNYANDQHLFLNAALNTQIAKFLNSAISFGPVDYASATPAVWSLGMSTTGTNTAVIGCFNNDGTNNARTELFAGGTAVGLNYAFSTGVDWFEFRRTGTTVMRYNSSSFELLSGGTMVIREAANAKSLQFNHNGTNGVIATGSGAGDIWLIPNGVTTATITPNGVDFYSSAYTRHFDAGNNAATTMKQNGTSFDISNSGAGHIAFYTSSVITTLMNSEGLAVYNGKRLALQNSGDTALTALNYLNGGGTNQLQIAQRGAAVHWIGGYQSSGDITEATSAPAATGGRPGQIVWVYE